MLVLVVLMHDDFLYRAVGTDYWRKVGRQIELHQQQRIADIPEKLISMSYTRILTPLTPTSHFSLVYYEIEESYPKSPVK